MSWNFSRVNLCRPIADGVHRVDEPRSAGIGLLVWFVRNSTAAQLLSEFTCGIASGVDVDFLDRSSRCSRAFAERLGSP